MKYHLEITNVLIKNITTKITGIIIINDIFWCIRKKYTKINKIDLIKTLNLNTPIIANECFIRFKKLIFEGMKDPLKEKILSQHWRL